MRTVGYVRPMISTLGEAWDAGRRIRVRCAWGKRDGMRSIRECLEAGELDMAPLVWTRGRDMPLTLIAERLRCLKSGSRRVRVFFDPPATGGRRTVTP